MPDNIIGTFLSGVPLSRISLMNSVPAPFAFNLPFPVFLYLMALIIFLCIVLIKKAHSFKDFKKALIISFVAVALIFALKMDLGWLALFRSDVKTFGGKDMDEKMAGVERIVALNDFYDFILFVKKNIPSGKAVRTITKDNFSYVPAKGKYYLLPFETSNNAEYIWVYNMPAIFDPQLKRLTLGEVSVSPVDMFAFYRQGAGIFKVIKE